MASQTDIANRALVKIGETRIINITDNNKAARTLNSMFDVVRDAELRARKWSFSIKRQNLAADVAVPLFGYGAQYQIPSDCLRVLSVAAFDLGPNLDEYIDAGNQPYVLEGRKILFGRNPTTEELPLRYISRITDTTQWDSGFVEAFACRLAAECAETLTQSSDKRRLAWQEYTQAVAAARRANAIELPAEYITEDTWTLVRLRG